jgi:hypothetical protein
VEKDGSVIAGGLRAALPPDGGGHGLAPPALRERVRHRGLELRHGRGAVAARVELQAFRFEPDLIARLPGGRAAAQMPPV